MDDRDPKGQGPLKVSVLGGKLVAGSWVKVTTNSRCTSGTVSGWPVRTEDIRLQK